jgi:hypothetical protein
VGLVFGRRINRRGTWIDFGFGFDARMDHGGGLAGGGMNGGEVRGALGLGMGETLETRRAGEFRVGAVN